LDQGIHIERVRIQTTLDGTVHMQFQVVNVTGQPFRGSLNLGIAAENHDGPGASHVQPVQLPAGKSQLDVSLTIPEPRLWWPWDQGQPHLYCLTARIDDADGQPLSELAETFGVRTVRLERTPERFTYWINERPVFVRGTSYMPGLYLAQSSRESLAQDVQQARAAHLNLLRAHVHVSPPEFYDLCDREGMLVWQDFELNWMHDPSPEFEARALRLQRDMIDLLGNHPSVITWACHNEPTMIFTQRRNLEDRPDLALYADAQEHDATRPVFICSGQMEADWQRAGDSHSYFGAIWSRRFTDVYRHRPRLSTEFGFETPAAVETLRTVPQVWARTAHLAGQIEALWDYQAQLIQYHVEHFRRLRADTCAGYVHFWFADLVPQIGPGVLDSQRCPKGGYEALRRASQPLLPALEHTGQRPCAWWIFNDTPQAYPGAALHWRVYDAADRLLLEDTCPADIAANGSQRLGTVHWSLTAAQCARIDLELCSGTGETLASNTYDRPFQPYLRPRGYPWKFDPDLGMKVFDRPGAPSLTDRGAHPAVKLVPLTLREWFIEWVLRQQFPTALLSAAARVIDRL
ncbi:MAG: hypothetical protein K8J31_13520, partial [Anaerolineae bacterium]|nr:hypothetical protein [Anaerolineae bacterium]